MHVINIDKNCKTDVLPMWCKKKSDCIALICTDGLQERILFVSEEMFYSKGLYAIETISDEEFNNLEEMFKIECAKTSAASFLFFKRYTTKEVREKLLRAGHEENTVDGTIDYYVKKGYLDDRKYVELYVESVMKNKIMSQKDMAMRLKNKGISYELVNEIAKIKGFDEINMAKRALKKKIGSSIIETREKKLKIMRFMAGKGYESYVIREAFSAFCDDLENEY